DYTAHLASQYGRDRLSVAPTGFAQWIELESRAMERAAHVCTRSTFVRDSIVNSYGIPAEKVTVIGGGLNMAPLPTPALGSPSHERTVLFIGKDFHRKGGDLLLLAFAAAREAVPTARLKVVADGPIPKHLPLAGVELIQPTWDRERIAELYRGADIFVLPSRLETWGDVLLEAMAYELPCIGVADSPMTEIINDRETGLIVKPNDIDDLARAMIEMLRDDDWRRSLGKRGRQRLEAHFTWDRVVERLAPILVTLGGGDSPAPERVRAVADRGGTPALDRAGGDDLGTA
ncbi:MAG TPA: glycosyltransferase family 4 protein, partial [Gemmatimonadaceae bacterium]|nr:glycosyltransferase family 4 protein [Gemmatimonadaceae bacterium]